MTDEKKPEITADMHRALRAQFGVGNYNIRPDGIIETRRGPNGKWTRRGRIGGKMSGRPRELANLIKVTVSLDDLTLQKATVLGNGNVSLGIRRMFEQQL